MRQITASVSFLPVVDELMAFDLLIYCKGDTAVPNAFEESAPQCRFFFKDGGSDGDHQMIFRPFQPQDGDGNGFYGSGLW